MYAVSFVKGNGKGQRKRPIIVANKGTTKTMSEYNNIDYITTVVDDSKTSKVIDTIMDAPSIPSLIIASMTEFRFAVGT